MPGLLQVYGLMPPQPGAYIEPVRFGGCTHCVLVLNAHSRQAFSCKARSSVRAAAAKLFLTRRVQQAN